MSSGTMYVRFPDGEIRYGIYHGTVEIAQAALFETSEAAWDHRKKCDHERVPIFSKVDGKPMGSLPSCAIYAEGAGEPVEVYSNYGGDWYWPATATRSHLTSNHEPLEIEQPGRPDWVPTGSEH